LRRGIDLGLLRRLRRLAAAVERRRPDLEYRRNLRAARQLVAGTIRAGLARAGLDPDAAPALHRFVQPDPLPWPDTVAPPGPVARLTERLMALARRRREAPPPDLAEASPAMLLAAYCFD